MNTLMAGIFAAAVLLGAGVLMTSSITAPARSASPVVTRQVVQAAQPDEVVTVTASRRAS